MLKYRIEDKDHQKNVSYRLKKCLNFVLNIALNMLKYHVKIQNVDK